MERTAAKEVRPAAGGASKPKPKPRPIDMRVVHRILSAVACLFLLYVGVTGSWIQLIDIPTILSGAPESNATMESINEGRFGNGLYSAVTLGGWNGAAVPANVDAPRAVATVMQAFAAAKPGIAPAFVELRMTVGRLVGQVAYADAAAPPDPRRRGTPVAALAFDAATGAPVAAADVRGAYPGPSLRQTLKQWHRFWGPDFFGLRDTPGVYLELVIGIALWVLIVTGLVTYFRLLKQRRKMKRPQLFWMNSDRWRSLHRGVSIAAAVLLVLVAASGTWLGFESSYATLNRHKPPKETLAITEPQAVRIVNATMKAFRADEPTTPIRLIRARIWYGQEEGAVVTATVPTRQRVYSAATGKEESLSSPHYPPNPFPFGLDVHEWVKHFHSGELLGLPARLLDLLAGLALVFLSASGLWMYTEMWRKRAKAGRRTLFWR